MTRAVRGWWTSALLLFASGCASMFMNGAVEHDGAPREWVARFTVPECRLRDGQPMAGSSQFYFLAQDERGPVLYELDARGEGVAIRNWWSDDRGQHFFAWVSNSTGWAFTFPADRTQLPTRYVFPVGSYRTAENEHGMLVPSGQPAARCTMVPR